MAVKDTLNELASYVPVDTFANSLIRKVSKSGIDMVISNQKSFSSVHFDVEIHSEPLALEGTFPTESSLSSRVFPFAPLRLYNSKINLSQLKIEEIHNNFKNKGDLGINEETFRGLLNNIGTETSGKLFSDFITGFNQTINDYTTNTDINLPVSNVITDRATVEFDVSQPSVVGDNHIRTILDEIAENPNFTETMGEGGALEEFVRVYVNVRDFKIMQNAVQVKGDYRESNNFKIEKQNLVSNFITYDNFVIRPMTGLNRNTVICTYNNDSLLGEAKSKVVYDSLNGLPTETNMAFVLKGAFRQDGEFDLSNKAINDFAWSLGKAVKISENPKSDNGYYFLAPLGFSLYIKDVTKAFFVLPTVQP